MSTINHFETLDIPKIESILRESSKVIIFRLNTLIFVRVLHNNQLLATATGESISTALKRVDSYMGSNFTMPELYTESLSKLDTILLDTYSTITVESVNNIFSAKITSRDEYLLAERTSNSIGNALQSLEQAAIEYGL